MSFWQMLVGSKVAPKKGIELIDAVTNRFVTMIEELTSGAEDCRIERDDIQFTIEQLQQKNAILDSSTKRATAIASNLRSLIGE